MRITQYKNIFSNDYTKRRSKEIFVIYPVLKPNPCVFKIEDLNEEKIIGGFSEKNS